MTLDLRWRVLTLQGVLAVVLAFCAGILLWTSAFVNGMIHDQLVAQKISFPPRSEIRPGGALDPREFPAEIRQHAGQRVDDGDRARIYANDFIAVHLRSVAGGKTYSQVSDEALANPGNATLQAQRNTLFQGETLRGLLLDAWGWSQVGTYAFWAGIGLAIAAAAVLGGLLYEVFVAHPAPAPVRRRTGWRALVRS